MSNYYKFNYLDHLCFIELSASDLYEEKLLSYSWEDGGEVLVGEIKTCDLARLHLEED